MAGQVKIGVVRQVHRRILVTDDAVDNLHAVLFRKRIGDGNLRIPRISLVAVRA